MRLNICDQLRLYKGVPGPSAPERMCVEAADVIESLIAALETVRLEFVTHNVFSLGGPTMSVIDHALDKARADRE